MDLFNSFARAIPARVICDLVGVPEPLRPRVLSATAAALHTAATPDQAKAGLNELIDSMKALIQDRRATPGEDLISDLLAEHGSADHLAEQHVISALVLVITAGSETPANLIASTALALLTHHGQRALLRTGDITWNDAIEETLRLEGPIMHMPLRYAVEDIPLGGGVTIPRGDAILLGFAAAGRDPSIHGDSADTFEARRLEKTHLAFGHDAHYCLGATLGRMEADIALRGLFHRFPRLRLAVPPQELLPQESFVVNGHQSIPVALRPSRRRKAAAPVRDR